MAITLWPAFLAAQTVHVRTDTVARGTQMRRGDLSRDASRFFSQSLAVWAFDTAPFLPGDVDAAAQVRYFDDFGVAARDRSDVRVQMNRSRFVLDQAYIRYRPVRAIRLTGGRLWAPSALGVRDIDGVRLGAHLPLAAEIDASVEGYVGREVSNGWGSISSSAWDVQGLPIDDVGRSQGGLRVGGNGALGVGDARIEAAWERRSHADDVGDERLGVALSGNVHSRLAVSAAASYHALLDFVDRGTAQLAWREPWFESQLTVGVEHRRPWFDSSSIFNVFGARPHDGAFAVWQRGFDSIDTRFELRGWGRAYDGNFDLSDLGGGTDDARAVGGGAGHSTHFHAFGRQWRWRSFGSVQTSAQRQQGGEQWLGDTSLRFGAIKDVVDIETRFVGIWVRPSVTASFGSGGAFTSVVGARVPTTFGDFRVDLEGQSSQFYGGNLNAYASFRADAWF